MSALALVFIGGIAIGICIGVVLDDALDLIRASRKDRRMTPKPKTDWRFPALIATLLLNLIVGALLVKTRADQGDYVECATGWQQDFATAYKVRLDASTAVSDAMDEVVRAVDAQKADRFRRAVDDYLRVRDDQVTERRKTPLPPLPETYCGAKP